MSEHIIDHYANQIPILPGEYLPAYLARLRKMTCGIEPRRLMSFSGSTQMGKLHQLFPRVASCFAYRPSERERSGALLQEHLGSRYWRGFLDEKAYKEHVQQVNLKVKSKRSIFEGEELLDSLKPMKFCEHCRDDDIERYGTPMWHAAHQVTSLYVCEKHRVPLHQFSMEADKTLLDYPVITNSVAANSASVQADPLRTWLDVASKQLLKIRTVHNRERIKDIKSDMARAFRAKETPYTIRINIEYRNAWRSYAADSLNALCPNEQCFKFFLARPSLGLTQQLKQNAPVRHPLIFLLAMKFAEDMVGGNLS